jgi:hypothetical protein
MGSFTNFSESRMLRHELGIAAQSFPGTLYLALFSATPSDTGGGTELAGSGYARQPITFAEAGQIATNTALIVFPDATADWVQATHWGVFDASTGGNLKPYGRLETSGGAANPQTVLTGNHLEFAIGSVAVSLD